MRSRLGRPYDEVLRSTVGEERILVLDTSGWIVLFGAERSPSRSISELLVTDAVARFEDSGYRLGYTSVTLYELRKTPRPEVRPWRRELLGFLRSRGVQVGPGYARLIELVSFAQEAYRHDAAIALAAGPHVLLTLDAWQAMFRLVMGSKTIYIQPELY